MPFILKWVINSTHEILIFNMQLNATFDIYLDAI